jgi:hypothetical protein
MNIPTENSANPNENRRTAMSYLNESLARAHMSERVVEAQQLRRGHQLAIVRRKSRRAERAALQARLTLARSL